MITIDDKLIQLEFSFTLKGRKQLYAIDQQSFLKDTYRVYLNHLHEHPWHQQSFDLFEQTQGIVYMKHFRNKYGDLYFPKDEHYY